MARVRRASHGTGSTSSTGTDTGGIIKKVVAGVISLASATAALFGVSYAGISKSHQDILAMNGKLDNKPTDTVIVATVNKVEMGKDTINYIFPEHEGEMVEKGIENDGKSTTIYYEYKKQNDPASYIASYVIDGIPASSFDDLYTRLYELNETDDGFTKIVSSVRLNKIYKEVSQLKTVFTEKQEAIDGIESKLKSVFGAEKVYQSYNSQSKDGTVRKQIEVYIPGENKNTRGQLVKFYQNGKDEAVTTNVFADNILTILNGNFPTGRFNVSGANAEDTQKIIEKIAEANAAQEKGGETTEAGETTNTETGTETSDPNASI